MLAAAAWTAANAALVSTGFLGKARLALQEVLPS